MITRIHWATLGVGDQDTMVGFLVDKLGFEKRTDAEMWPGARWVEVAPKGERTGPVLTLATDFGREPSTEYPVGFSCSSLPETAEQLRAVGVTVTDPVTEPWGNYIRVTPAATSAEGAATWWHRHRIRLWRSRRCGKSWSVS